MGWKSLNMSASLFHSEKEKPEETNMDEQREHTSSDERCSLSKSRYTHIHQNPWYFRHLTLRLHTCNLFVSFPLLPISIKVLFFGKKCTLMRSFPIYCNKKCSMHRFRNLKKWLTNRNIDVHRKSVWWEKQRGRGRWRIIDSLPHCGCNKYTCTYIVCHHSPMLVQSHS